MICIVLVKCSVSLVVQKKYCRACFGNSGEFCAFATNSVSLLFI